MDTRLSQLAQDQLIGARAGIRQEDISERHGRQE